MEARVDTRVEHALAEARTLFAYLKDSGALDALDPEDVLAADAWAALNSEKPFSDEAREYLKKLVSGAPRKRRSMNWHRDKWIATMVARIVKHGFPPTRNDASRSKKRAESACSIVVRALNEVGVKLQERTVEDIWRLSDQTDHSGFPHGVTFSLIPLSQSPGK